MPTWANHFRVADKLLSNIKKLDTEYFLIGNIAPDCGIPTGINGEYIPSTSITHFTIKDISNKTDCDYNFIYENFIKNETDIKKLSFFIGYFVHLYTDCEYAIHIYLPIEKENGCFSDHPLLWKKVKKEIESIDNNYLSNNIIPSFELFKSYNGFNENYPDWYKNNEISKQMKNIVNLYSKPKREKIKHNYITPEQISAFLDDTVTKLFSELNNRNIYL